MPYGAIAAGVGAVGSAIFGSKRGGSGAKQAQLQPFTYNNGAGTTATVNRNSGSLDLGQAGDTANTLLDWQGNALNNLDRSPERTDAAYQLYQQTNNNPYAAFNVGQGEINSAQGFASGLDNTLLQGAGTQFDFASQDPTALANSRLDLLRQQAAPFEQRAGQALNDNQFATGRLGTTGGFRGQEAFARGLGQADLSRQLASFDFARTQQNDAANRGTQFLQGAGGIRDQREALIAQLFGRQQSATGGADARALQRYGAYNQYLDEQSGRLSQQRGLNDANSYLQTAFGIQDQGLKQSDFALRAASGGAAAGANYAQFQGQQANAKYGALADVFGGIAGAGYDYYNRQRPQAPPQPSYGGYTPGPGGI